MEAHRHAGGGLQGSSKVVDVVGLAAGAACLPCMLLPPLPPLPPLLPASSASEQTAPRPSRIVCWVAVLQKYFIAPAVQPSGQVEDFLEKSTRDERQGLAVEGVPDADLFFEDKVGSSGRTQCTDCLHGYVDSVGAASASTRPSGQLPAHVYRSNVC